MNSRAGPVASGACAIRDRTKTVQHKRCGKLRLSSTASARTKRHRRRTIRRGCADRLTGTVHSQEATHQTRRHGGVAYRQKALAEFQR